SDMGAPTWPPNPQTFGAPRRSRGAPRDHAWPEASTRPVAPDVRSAAAQPWRSSGSLVAGGLDASRGPKRSERPGAAAALLGITGGRRPRRAPWPQTFGAPRCSRGAPRDHAWPEASTRPVAPDVRSAPAQPWRSWGSREVGAWRIQLPRSRQRRNATIVHTASTRPNGQAPCRKPYAEASAQAAAN